ncbi:MAG: adenylate kinase [Nanoarchaeota archaeon]|mgnify:CR=1 FL=1
MKKIILGPPGSGKGTAASRIAPKRNIVHISTGDLLRENIRKQTPIGIKTKEFLENGDFVPDNLIINLIENRLKERDTEKGFILDGFPRTINQAKKLLEITDIDLLINMDVTEDVIIKRILTRLSCSHCNKIYNTRTIIPRQEGICDDCKNPLIKRSDDEIETIRQRLVIYKEMTKPIINFYKDKLVIKDVICNDLNQTPEETFQEVLDIIEGFEKENSQLEKDI